MWDRKNNQKQEGQLDSILELLHKNQKEIEHLTEKINREGDRKTYVQNFQGEIHPRVHTRQKRQNFYNNQEGFVKGNLPESPIRRFNNDCIPVSINTFLK